MWRWLWDQIRRFAVDRATGYARWQLREMESLFVALVGGPLAGLPTVSTPISLELLACLEPDELERYVLASAQWDDDLGTVAGNLDVT